MTKDIVETVAAAIQDHNATAQIAQCMAEGYTAPEGPQWTLWDQLGEVERDYVREIAQVAIAAHQSALSSAGYVIVPREPTEAMWDAGDGALEMDYSWTLAECRAVWTAMLDAFLKENP